MTVFELTNATVLRDNHPVLQNFTWTVREGEAWAIVGPTGSGKTTLAETLLGKHSLHGGVLTWPLFDRLRTAGRRIDYTSQAVAHVAFKEDSRLFSYAGRYYQQRFEFADSSSDTPVTLADFLATGTAADRAALCKRFKLAELLPQPFMTLSNGQTRRARLVRAMLAKPEILILDDPFIGLDTTTRADFGTLLRELRYAGNRVVLICREDAIPPWITNVLRLSSPSPLAGEGGSENHNTSGPGERANVTPEPLCGPSPARRECNENTSCSPGDVIVELSEVTVTHAGYTILDRVSWTVRAGERWAILGPNGSGKTTLLSLLCGDHPQAYANDIRLFGRRRGTGETIWDVKRNIGLLSPEFHLYFTEPLTAARTAATGFFDTLADRPTTPEQADCVRELFAAFGITYLANRAFKHLSTGEQRLVLLVRSLVKRPPLLILDEPFQGMDAASTARCRDWLDQELKLNQTLLFVTHEPTELPRSVLQTLRLERGRVL